MTTTSDLFAYADLCITAALFRLEQRKASSLPMVRLGAEQCEHEAGILRRVQTMLHEPEAMPSVVAIYYRWLITVTEIYHHYHDLCPAETWDAPQAKAARAAAIETRDAALRELAR